MKSLSRKKLTTKRIVYLGVIFLQINIFPHQYLLSQARTNMCEKLFFSCPEGKDGLTNRITGFVLSLTNKCLCKLWFDSDV